MRGLQPAELANLVVQGEIEGAIIRKDEALAQAIAAALPAGAMLLSVDGAIGKAEDFAACRGERGRITGDSSARSRSPPPSFSTRRARPGCQKASSSRTARPSIALSGYRRRPGFVRAPTTGRSAWCRSATLSASTALYWSRSPTTARFTRCPLSTRSPRTISSKSQQDHLLVLGANALSGHCFGLELQARKNGVARSRSLRRRANHAGPARSHRS